jgi:UDP-N-acetylmuramate dehydrogenase
MRTLSGDSLSAGGLDARFGNRLLLNAPLSRFTSAQVGGVADAVLVVNSVEELVEAVSYLWDNEHPFMVLGGGSNILVSDRGYRGVVVHNRARDIFFIDEAQQSSVWAESGANFGLVARQAAARGLAGLEWAAGIPGTVGGAVVGNAGAHGSCLADRLVVADILHHQKENNSGNGLNGGRYRREEWSAEQFRYTYRSSLLKDEKTAGRVEAGQPNQVVLAATLHLERSSLEAVRGKMVEYVTYRRRTQPPGASMGSMFKNPPGDIAGRLIEAAGLKGKRIGQAEISRMHANFFVNHGGATAQEIWELIRSAQQAVAEKFGISLELEIELVGEWDA